MRSILSGLKTFFIVLILLVFALLSVVHPAYARGGFFLSGTEILTSTGPQMIESLRSGDRVLGYDFATHHQREEVIGAIEQLQVADYYLINEKIWVTGSHPFYVQNGDHIQLVKVDNLQVGDQLLQDDLTVVAIARLQRMILRSFTKCWNIVRTSEGEFWLAGIQSVDGGWQ